MMREIIFYTETTGLLKEVDRVIEIGCVELVNRFPTGRSYHCYINPQGREIHPDAEAVHGISATHLADKPVFDAIAPEFLEFIDDGKLVAHNASFDMGFINAEFARVGIQAVSNDRVIDTLEIARRKHPMGPNSLDALCKRYGVDLSRRTKHGALLDAELLAEVYIELVGGKQAALVLDNHSGSADQGTGAKKSTVIQSRVRPLPSRLSDSDIEAHRRLVETLGENAIWKQSGFYES
jgi:DNA polymerase-3 subunit epsilon